MEPPRGGGRAREPWRGDDGDAAPPWPTDRVLSLSLSLSLTLTRTLTLTLALTVRIGLSLSLRPLLTLDLTVTLALTLTLRAFEEPAQVMIQNSSQPEYNTNGEKLMILTAGARVKDSAQAGSGS